MSFKLSKETGDHYIMTHKDGSFLKIAKKGLSKDIHTHIQKLAKGGEVNNPKLQQSHIRNYDEGGKIQKPVDESGGNPFDVGRYPLADATWNFLTGNKLPGVPTDKKPLAQETPADEVISQETQKAFQVPPPEQNMTPIPAGGMQPAAQPPSQPQSPAQPNLQDMMAQRQGDLLQQEQTALTGANKAQEQYGQSVQKQSEAEVEANANHAAQQQDFLDRIDNQEKAFSLESQKQMDDFSGQKIDFNRMWHDKSAGNKAVTLMGVLLGGFGSGLTGQSNAAMQVIDKMMERDVDQQKSELGKKQTLYGMFLKKYGYERDATVAHMAALNNIFNGQMQQIAAQQKGPQAMAAAQMAINERNMKMLPELNSMFIRRAAMDQLQQQMSPGRLPSGAGAQTPQYGLQPNANGKTLRLMNMAGLVNDKQLDEATKELKGHQENEAIRGSLTKDFGRLQKMLEGGGNLNQSEIQSIFNSSAGKLTKLQSGRFNMEEAKSLMQSILPGMPIGIDLSQHGFNVPLKVLVKDSAQTQANKLERLNSLFNAESYPTLEGLNMYQRHQ